MLEVSEEAHQGQAWFDAELQERCTRTLTHGVGKLIHGYTEEERSF